MNAASFSTSNTNLASDRKFVTLSMFDGMALPPMPIFVQSISSPSSLYTSLPTTTPFSDATTCSELRVHPSRHEISSSTASESFWSLKSLTSV